MKLVASLRAPTWSPYLGGIVLGVLVTTSMALFGHRLSGAGAYEALSGYVGKEVAPASFYWRQIMPPAITWDVWAALGVLLGSFASSRFGRTFAFRLLPDEGWIPVFGPSIALRWALAFAGSLLTGLGAGLAGGCTASLVVSGGAVLAPGAFVFMAGMFAGGIPALRIVDRLLRRRRGR